MSEKTLFPLQFLLLFLFISWALPSLAQPPYPTRIQEPQANHMPMLTRTGPGIFRMGTIQINKRQLSIIFPASVNMDSGLVEYLLVKSTGKTHESVLRTDVDPYYLNIAFLLLGLEGTSVPISAQGAHEEPEGDPVDIEITYREGTVKKRSPASEWIVKRKAGKESISQFPWVYTGSTVQQGEFLAQLQGSIIAIFHDPAALIDNTNMEGDNDEIWFVNQQVVPPIGTEVIVKISAKRKKCRE